MTNVPINGKRLLADLENLRNFGRKGSGVQRPAFSKADWQARHWLADRMRQAGLEPTFDPAGNLFGLPSSDHPVMLSGSHSDSQPEGGWLDGAFGVIAALEAARALNEAGRAPIAVVSFQDEEGRFGALTGSSIWSGRMTLDEADALTDLGGTTFAQARRAGGDLHSGVGVPPNRFRGFIEAHIEQGPVLDDSGLSVGVVQSIVGIRGFTVTMTGEQNHAGTTPMDRRRDAFQGLAEFATELNAVLGRIVSPATVWTIGHVALRPNAASIVPGAATFSVQWRDADSDLMDVMETEIHRILTACASRRGLQVAVGGAHAISPITCDAKLVGVLTAAAALHAPGQNSNLNSGALHDASNVSLLMPAAMLFVPSIGGISHSFDEDTDLEHLVTGAQVLATALESASTISN